MSRTPQSRILSLASSAAFATGLGMIPLHRLPRPVKTGYIALPAVLGAGAAVAALCRRDPGAREAGHDAPRRNRSTALLATLPLAVGGIIAGSGVVSIWIDRGVEGFLRRRGVPAPRVAMGLASGALALTMDLVSERRSALAEDPTLEEHVLALLSEADPMQLDPGRRGGAAAEEYQPEAEAITEILRRDGVITAVQLDEVWQDWFNTPLTLLLGEARAAALAAELSAEAAELSPPPSAR